jgi:hypothetical protein
VADAVRTYFDNLNPAIVAPGEGRLGGPRQMDLFTAWNRLSKALFLTYPQQLDRCKVNRNKYVQTVR